MTLETPCVPSSPPGGPTSATAVRSRLRWRIVCVLLAASLLPMVLLGVGAWFVLGRTLERRALDLQEQIVASHASAIENSLDRQKSLLTLLASTESQSSLADPERLEDLLEILNAMSDGGFVDLGLIAADGEHVAYVGPFDLAGRNYHSAEWFAEVMASGEFVSEVFLGFRGVPHLVIAVRLGGHPPWVLRATVNSERFDAMVRTGALGPSGEAYLVNRQGLYQTASASHPVLSETPLDVVQHRGVRERRLELNGADVIVMTTWINHDRWCLVVSQNTAEIRAPVVQAAIRGALVLGLAVAAMVLTTMLATRHLGRQIDRANAQREHLMQAFLRSSKLASLGELATGLAHEINNPLAIVGAEQTNIGDLLDGLRRNGEAGVDTAVLEELCGSSERIKRQVNRCASITGKMLQFGRAGDCEATPTAVLPHLESIVSLLQRQATIRNISLELEPAASLPLAVLDPTEVEQVLVNLITNAFQALPHGGRVLVRATASPEDDAVVVEVVDNGSGMSPETLDRAMEPFFTTKPVGEGTGLGLSVCFGLVRSWGGTIEVESEPDVGTTVRFRVPAATSTDSPVGEEGATP